MKDHIIVCGLGSLGQHCVRALKEFGVTVVGIEDRRPQYWEFVDLETQLAQLVFGDCRRPEILQQAGVETCRAVLLVTSNPHVNVGTALAVRHFNRNARLVIRSAQTNLDRLLADYLGNFSAFEPTHLPAATFALAALGTDTIGFFQQDDKWFRVIEQRVTAADTWCLGKPLHKLHHGANRRVVRHIPAAGDAPQYTFHAWEPDALVQVDDVLVTLEMTTYFAPPVSADQASTPTHSLKTAWQAFKAGCVQPSFKSIWQGFQDTLRHNQMRRVTLVYSLAVLGLLLSGTLLFYFFYPQTTLLDNFFATTVLLLGGYADVFGVYKGAHVDFPWWLQLVGLFFALAGIALVGLLYGLVTEALLESKFQFVIRRPPIPTAGHIVVVGLGRVGQKVAALLHELGQPVVGVALHSEVDPALLPQLPLVTGQLTDALDKINLSTARSVVATTDEELLNLEIGLMARAANPHCHLVIRTFEQTLSDSLTQLLPRGEVFSAYRVAADAFASATFGENILGVFRLNQRTILIAEYEVRANDSLNGLMLADVAYGFAVVPVILRQKGAPPKLLVTDEVRLKPGDCVVLLATMDGIRRIEHNQRTINQPLWDITIRSIYSEHARFEAAQVLALIGGLPLGEAKTRLAHLPATLRLSLYKYQAHRLLRKLKQHQILVEMRRFS